MAGEYVNKEFLDAMAELEQTKGIKMDVLLEALEDALISAYKKNYGSSQNVRVEINREDGDIHVYYRKEVVAEVENDKIEMSLEEAQSYDRQDIPGSPVHNTSAAFLPPPASALAEMVW